MTSSGSNEKSNVWVKGEYSKPEPTIRYKKVRDVLIKYAENAIMPKVKVWYQVYSYPQDRTGLATGFDPVPICYGFSAIDGIVVDAPNWQWRGKRIEEIKHNFKADEYCRVIELKFAEHELL